MIIQVIIENVPATVVIGPYKNVHVITPASVVKRVPDDIGDRGQPDTDAPGLQPPSPPGCPGDLNALILDLMLISNSSGVHGPPLLQFAPCAQGVCTSHLTGWYYGDYPNLEPFGLEILMKGAAGTHIGWQVHTAADVSHPL